MRKSFGGIFAKGIVLSLIPAICSYLSQSNNILSWLQKKGYLGANVDVEFLQNAMGIASIFFTFTLLTYPLIVNELKLKEYKQQRDSLIKNNKDIFEATLKNVLQLEHCRLNVRIFVPKITLCDRLKKRFTKSGVLEYHIRNIDGLAEKDITDSLAFQVFPDKQGLVGDCYNQKAVLYDDDLENSNEINYNLTRYQIAKTNKLKFILVCPIFSEKEEIISIISLDSYDIIKIRDETKDILRNLVLNYTQSLYECIPELFKPKGGIL